MSTAAFPEFVTNLPEADIPFPGVRGMISQAPNHQIIFIITFLTTRERIIPRLEQKSSVKDDLSDLSKNRPWLIMLILTILVFITLAMKGGSYVYYFNNYVDKVALTDFISPLISDLSAVGINFFGSDPIAAGFGLFNAGGIIFMIVGISLSKKLADKYGKRDVYKYAR